MSASERRERQRKARPLTGKAVLIWFLSFFFAIVAVNVLMIYLAVSTFSGVSTEDAYRQGRDYNDTLRQARQQNALQWQVEVSYQSSGEGAVELMVFARDKKERPLSDLSVEATFWRPTSQGMDQTKPLEAKGEGKYVTVFDLPAAGNWQIRIEAEGPNGSRFRRVEQAFIKP